MNKTAAMATRDRSSIRSLASYAWVLLLLAGCGSQEAEAPPEAPVVRPVKSMVLPEHGGATRTFPGTVRATNRVDLSFNDPGKLIELPVTEGELVEQGQLLARLDPEDYAALATAAEAEYNKALADYQRSKELVEKDYVSQSDFDKAVSQKEVATAKLARARKALDDTRMRAPFDGVIARRYVENHTDVRAKQPVLSLQDTRTLEVVVDVPEDVVAMYRAASTVPMTARFSALPGREFPVSIKEASAQADPGTRTYQVVFALGEHKRVNLLPGMTAEVSVPPEGGTTGDASTFNVPATALIEADGKTWVWVIDPKTNRVSRREVQAEATAGGSVVVHKGLEALERIATAGVHYLKEGREVKPVTEIRF